MRVDIRNYLVEVARKGGNCSYSDLNNKFKLGLDFDLNRDRVRIGDLLGDIATYEHGKGRPILSAVVMHKGDALHGDGIYRMGEILTGKPASQLKRDFFAETQMGLCHAYWRDDENYARDGVMESLVG
jgi:hypothetical protein